jgi:hypothetical protein
MSQGLFFSSLVGNDRHDLRTIIMRNSCCLEILFNQGEFLRYVFSRQQDIVGIRRFISINLIFYTLLSTSVGYNSSRNMKFPHVFLEVKVPAESFVTNVTSVGFLVVVCMHVKGEIVDLVKGLVTNVTLVLLVSRMSQLVVLVVAFLMESFATEFTDPGLQSRMDPHMSVQGRRTIEALAALCAPMRLLLRVNDLMSAESGCLPESFATDLTDKWSRSRVDGHVTSQIVVSVEHFPTVFAGEDFALVVLGSRGRRETGSSGRGRSRDDSCSNGSRLVLCFDDFTTR